jgi:hypothetical protein
VPARYGIWLETARTALPRACTAGPTAIGERLDVDFTVFATGYRADIATPAPGSICSTAATSS